MKRLTSSVISLLVILFLFSCTTERKSAGSVSLKFSENASSKISLLSTARSAESSLDHFDVVLTVSGDYEASKSIRITDEKELNGLVISVEEIDAGSNISVTLEIINNSKVYYKGSASLVVTEGENPVKIKLVKLVEDSKEEIIEDIIEVETPEEEKSEEIEETDKKEEAPAEVEEENTESEEKTEENGSTEGLPETKPEGGNIDKPAADKENRNEDSWYVLYDSDRTDFRSSITESDKGDKGANCNYFCFDQFTGDVIGVTSSNVARYKKSVGYDAADNYSFNFQGNVIQFVDICYMNNILYALEADSNNVSGYYLGSNVLSDVTIELPEDTNLKSKYSSVEKYGIKSDGQYFYIFYKCKGRSGFEHFVSIFDVITTESETIINSVPTKIYKSVFINKSENKIISYDESIGSHTILGKQNYKASEYISIGDLTTIGNKVYILVNDRSVSSEDDKVLIIDDKTKELICRGALIELTLNTSLELTGTESNIYGWNKSSNSYSLEEDKSIQLLGPTRFNRISKDSIAFVDEGFYGTMIDNELKFCSESYCRVITINVSALKNDGNLILAKTVNQTPSSSFGTYVETSYEDFYNSSNNNHEGSKFAFSNFKLNQ